MCPTDYPSVGVRPSGSAELTLTCGAGYPKSIARLEGQPAPALGVCACPSGRCLCGRCSLLKRALSLIVAFCLLAPAALARQWTARGGGFTVEAEFVELKDGNVILKQNDGKLLRIPLEKLSPDDVDYVNALLQPADTGMGRAAEFQEEG